MNIKSSLDNYEEILKQVNVKSIKENIQETLGVKKENTEFLNETYVRQPKKFNLNLDTLSSKNLNHHFKLYEDYVSKLNKVNIQIDALDKKNTENLSKFKDLKDYEQYLLNAVMLHELFFENLTHTSNSIIHQDSKSYVQLSANWDDFDDWQRDALFCIQSSKSSGWFVCGYSFSNQRYMNLVIDDHNINHLLMFYPVLVIDCFEHSYYLDYGTEKKNYAHNMLLSVKWDAVEKRMEKIEQIKESWARFF